MRQADPSPRRMAPRAPRAAGLALILAFVLTCQPRTGAADAAPPAPAPNTALEALRRLKGLDLEANPALKAAVLRVLESTRGTPAFVELVRDFDLQDQDAGLLEVAAKYPAESAGADAIRRILESGHIRELASALGDAPPGQRPALVQAVANTPDPRTLPLLSHAAADPALPVTARSAAVRGLARSEEGAKDLLQLGRDGRLDEALRNSAGLVLAQSRWPAVREEAARVFPVPRAADGSALPPIAELAKQTGSASRGRGVFQGERAACSRCHQVAGEGTDFGPALTLIGSKLGREALLDAILDPSAGISFGYEGWDFELKNGDELSGLIASETPDELALKQQTGVVVRIRKAEIARRSAQKLSVMPAGLGQILSRDELVDLVEYLAGLRTPEPATPR